MIEQLLVRTAGLLAAPAPKDDGTMARTGGTWIVVSATRKGKADKEIKDDKILFKDGTVTVTSKKKDEKATYKVNDSRKPKEIDIMPEKGKEKEAILGI